MPVRGTNDETRQALILELPSQKNLAEGSRQETDNEADCGRYDEDADGDAPLDGFDNRQLGVFVRLVSHAILIKWGARQTNRPT